MEGAGYLERWIFEVLEGLGATKLQNVYVTGGAAKSETWLSIRASILDLQLQRPAVAESAFGAAILAASGKLGGVSAATRAMVRPDMTIDPDPGLQAPYEERYLRFREACAERGYGAS
jgi:xylulokinase